LKVNGDNNGDGNNGTRKGAALLFLTFDLGPSTFNPLRSVDDGSS